MATIEKNIIFKKSEDVATPSAGNTVIYRLLNKLNTKFSKNDQGVVSEIKSKNIVEFNAFSSHYFSVSKSMKLVKEEGFKAIESLIIKEYEENDRKRIFDALDKVPSFHIALIHGDIARAKERVSTALSDGVILQADADKINAVLELAEQI